MRDPKTVLLTNMLGPVPGQEVARQRLRYLRRKSVRLDTFFAQTGHICQMCPVGANRDTFIAQSGYIFRPAQPPHDNVHK